MKTKVHEMQLVTTKEKIVFVHKNLNKSIGLDNFVDNKDYQLITEAKEYIVSTITWTHKKIYDIILSDIVNNCVSIHQGL